MRVVWARLRDAAGRRGAVPPRIGVFCHIFYPDLAAEILAHLSNIPGSVDVLISTDAAAKAAAISGVFGAWRKGVVEVAVVPNRGRDIGPRLTYFRDHHRRYDLVLYLHTKRGQNVVDGDAWRQYLYLNLVGSVAVVETILAAFAQEKRLGVVFPPHWGPVAPFIDWGGNVEHGTMLARRMGLPGLDGVKAEFPSGSMFWARAAALEPLLGLKLEIDAFEPELGQVDTTLAHAVERMFLLSCRRAGYRWRNIGAG